jgi:hypothetical protein
MTRRERQAKGAGCFFHLCFETRGARERFLKTFCKILPAKRKKKTKKNAKKNFARNAKTKRAKERLEV